MTSQNDQGSVDRQYLKAMGIELWIDRNSTLAVQPQPAPVVTAATTASAVGKQKALSEMSASELTAAMADLKVTYSDPARQAPLRQADLLVVTDGSSLTGECSKLLDSMFKAIELDQSQWLHAGFSHESSETIAQLGESVSHKAVLIMLRTGGDAEALAELRGAMHKSPALESFIVVTFHPQDLLDNPAVKRPAWEDLKQLRQWLG